uniref:DNA polymerase n=1 Tax=Rheinheimera sp. TaxID=1869214 RepID=UPI0040476F6B
SPRPLSLDSQCFDRSENGKNRYLILGFDTEYQSNQTLYTIQELRENPALAERDILSYQYSVLSDDHVFYNGIIYPPHETSFLKQDRLSIEEFLYIALADGVKNYGLASIPLRIYLVGHFNRADLPTFRNIGEISKKLDSLRGTFMSVKGGINNSLYVGFEFEGGGQPIVIDIGIRDTITLTPNLRTKLSDIGDLVGVEKVRLHEDPKEEKRLKSNMRTFMLENPELFEKYAMRDSDICVHYLRTMIDLYQQNTSKKEVPFTLSQIGVDILLEHWKSEPPIKGESYKLDVLGKEKFQDQYFHVASGKTKFHTREDFVELIYPHQTLVTECYHGGRNEQFQFGVSKEDDWFDYDLTSAYPISMSLLGLPDWESIRFAHDNSLIDRLDSPHQLVFAQVEFCFPELTRFPCIPVRSRSGPVFPLSGKAFASAPELFLAKQLDCEIRVIQGLSLKVDESHHPFYGFIKHTVTKRKEEREVHGKGSMNEVFWKEVTNSVYGKVAQGLGFKRRYDLRQRGGKNLEPSKVTQPFYAAHITSYIRAALGEIMNRTPVTKEVFSVTTDGFITNVNQEQIKRCCTGKIVQDFTKMVRDIRGEEALEVKHRVRQLIGWKTRGQATLKPHPELPIVLAKGAERVNDFATPGFINSVCI